MFDITRLTYTQRKRIIRQVKGLLSRTACELDVSVAAVHLVYYGRTISENIRMTLEKRIAEAISDGKVTIKLRERAPVDPSKTAKLAARSAER